MEAEVEVEVAAQLVACPGAMATSGMSSRPSGACVLKVQVSSCQC